MAAVETAPRPEAAGALQFGRVFTATFGVIGRNWVTLALASLIFAVAPEVLLNLASGSIIAPAGRAVLGMSVVLALVRAAPMALLHSVASFLVQRDGERGRAPFSLFTGVAYSAPRVVLTQVVVTLCTMLGTMLLVIPGLIVALAWTVATPTSALEGRGLGALTRSAALTRNHRGEIFGIVLAYQIPFVALLLVGWLILGALNLSQASTHWPMVTLRAAETFLSAPFSAVVGAVLYFELRRLKDGILPAEAAVFD